MNLGADTDFEIGDVNDPRSFERFLREHGFSRSRAKAITAKGFKSSSFMNGYDQEEMADLVSTLDRSRQLIEQKRPDAGTEIVGRAVEGFVNALTTHELEKIKDQNAYNDAVDLFVDLATKNRRYSNNHVVEMRPGDTHPLTFKANHDNNQRKLLISVRDRKSHKFSARFNFSTWSNSSVTPDFEDFHFDTSKDLVKRYTVGNKKHLMDWLATINTGKARQAKGAARHPTLSLVYKGTGDPDERAAAKVFVSLK